MVLLSPPTPRGRFKQQVRLYGPVQGTAGELFDPAGTICYMSPEEVRGEDVDARTDLFSLGVVLFEALSGRRPFSGSSLREFMYAILNEDPPGLQLLNPRVPVALERIVRRLLSKSAQRRYSSAAELLMDLKAIRPHMHARSMAFRGCRPGSPEHNRGSGSHCLYPGALPGRRQPDADHSRATGAKLASRITTAGANEGMSGPTATV
jgi:serine/threonine protein kinase